MLHFHMKRNTIRTLVLALALITSANVLLRFLRKLVCDDCLEILILSKILLAAISMVFILRYGFNNVLRNGIRVFSIWTLVALALLIMAFLKMEQILAPQDISAIMNLKFLVYTLSTGFFEEIFFRVFVFYFIFRSMKNSENVIWKSTLWASFCFGLAHVTNLLDGFDTISLIIQIGFAMIVGIILQGVYLRTMSIILIGTLHGLINYFGTYRIYLFKLVLEETDEIEWDRLITTLIILGVLSLIFIIPIRRYLKSSARIPEIYLK